MLWLVLWIWLHVMQCLGQCLWECCMGQDCWGLLGPILKHGSYDSS